MTTDNHRRLIAGHAAEAFVCELIASWGWKILDRNVHLGHYEIDIIAQDGRSLVVIEVRFRGRGAFTTGFGSLTPNKRRFVRLAGERLWDRRFRHDPSIDFVRFDAASVRLDADGQMAVEYTIAAF